MNNVLIVVAHPDDEVLGMGATIAKFVQEGKRVRAVVLNKNHRKRDEGTIHLRYDQCVAALKMIGVKNYHIYNLFVSDYQPILMEINEIVYNEVFNFQPDTVFTHIDSDLNLDHRVVNEAVMVACRTSRSPSVKNVITFPVISSSEINPSFNFVPNLLIGVTMKHLKKRSMQ